MPDRQRRRGGTSRRRGDGQTNRLPVRRACPRERPPGRGWWNRRVRPDTAARRSGERVGAHSPASQSGTPHAEWSHQHTLNAGLIVIGLLAIVSSGASLFASTVLVRDMTALAAARSATSPRARRCGSSALREISDASAALLTGDEQYARAAEPGSAAVRDRSTAWRRGLADPEGRSLVDRVRVAERDYQEAFERARAPPAAGGRRPPPPRWGPRARPRAGAGRAGGAHGAGVGRRTRGHAGLGGAHPGDVQLDHVRLDRPDADPLRHAPLLVNRTIAEQSSTRLLAEEGQTRTSAALNEAKAASHLKDEFLATVSHELRNPLAPILTWTQLLRSGTLDREKVDRGLEVIERNVVSLSELIDDLVDVSRVVSGKFRLDVRPIDLPPVIRAAVESQRPASDAKQIRLQLVLDERAGMISGDSERLQQVMGNLLSNAIKFTPKGGSVQVTLGRAESHVEMAVADSGIGIEAAFLPHVFEPFQQATDGTMRRHGGLGLGLSIVRHIVELHGGEIVAESPGAGQGSRFTIKLPLLGTGAASRGARPRHPMAADGIADVAAPPARPHPGAARGRRADRERGAADPARVVRRGGADRGVGRAGAPDARRLEAGRADFRHRHAGGGRLRADPEGPGAQPGQGGDIPAAALTAYAKIEDRVRILAAGFQMYLSKPADPSELIAVVASLAGRRLRKQPGSPAPTSSPV